MPRRIGDLKIRLGLDVKRFEKELRGIRKRLGNIQGFIGAAFAAAGVAKIANFTKNIVDAGDKITKLRDGLGETTDFLQFLDFAAKRSGTNLESLATATQRARRRFSEFATTGKGEVSVVAHEMSEEFRELARNGATFEDLLPIIARDLGNLANHGDRLRVAMKLFDSEGARPMLAFLKDGPDGVRQLAKEFEDLGGAVDEKSLNAMADINDELTNISFALRNAFIPVLKEALPLIRDMAKESVKLAKELRGLLAIVNLVRDPKAMALGKFAGKNVSVSGGGEDDGGPRNQPGMNNFPENISEALSPETFEAKTGEATAPIIEGFNDTWANIADTLDTFVEESMATLGSWGHQIKGMFFNIFEGFTAGVGQAVANALVWGESLAEGLKNLMKNIASFIISELIRMALQKFILDRISQASTLASSKSQVSAYAGQAFAGTFAWWSSVFAPVASTMATIAGAAALAGGMAFLADGGIVNSATAAVIGEAGPEAVIPLNRMSDFISGGNMTVIWEVDGRELAAIVTEHQPGVLHIEGIGT